MGKRIFHSRRASPPPGAPSPEGEPDQGFGSSLEALLRADRIARDMLERWDRQEPGE
ncbi:MAG TPA: hypothetical protein VFD73_21230 [Gemmatimonadales bacterium]|nr:hypothetical protein [Gemmatimonadales bacterium]